MIFRIIASVCAVSVPTGKTRKPPKRNREPGDVPFGGADPVSRPGGRFLGADEPV
jgi:hypothetical protein